MTPLDPRLVVVNKEPHKPAPKPSPLGGVWASDLGGIEPPRWTIKGLIPEGAFGVLYGPPGSFKSFMAIDMGLSMASGFDWLGRRTKPGAVLYIACEGGGGLGARIEAWKRHHDADAPEGFRLVRASLPLSDPATVEALLDETRFMKEAGRPPRLIIVDTLARAMAGADENAAGDMGKAIHALERLGRETGATVLAVHHTGKDADRGPRGSSALHGAVDFMISVKAVGTLGADLTIEKQKDGRDGVTIALDLIEIELGRDEDGEAFGSLVATESSRKAAKAGKGKGRRLTPKEEGDLAVIRKTVNEKGKPDQKEGRAVMHHDRHAVRLALIQAERLDHHGTVTNTVTGEPLTDAERGRLSRLLKSLKDKGKIGFDKDSVWVFEADQEGGE